MGVVLGIDVSLTSTGLAAMDDDLFWTEAIKSGATSKLVAQVSRRLSDIADRVEWRVIELKPDLVVIEAPSHGSRFGSPHERSGLWWAIVESVVKRGIPIAQVSPKSRAKYATGDGNADKAQVHRAVQAQYATEHLPIKSNDEADAVVLAAMGARHLGYECPFLPATHLSAMDKVVWPL